MKNEKLLREIADDLRTFVAIAGPIPSYDCPLRQAADRLDQFTDLLGMKRSKFRRDGRRPNRGMAS